MIEFIAKFKMADARGSNVRYYPIKSYNPPRAQLLFWPINETDRLSTTLLKKGQQKKKKKRKTGFEHTIYSTSREWKDWLFSFIKNQFTYLNDLNGSHEKKTTRYQL